MCHLKSHRDAKEDSWRGENTSRDAAFSACAPPVKYTSAVSVTGLIVFIFMEVHYDKGIVRVFAGAGLIWLLFFLLTFSDYLTRTWRF
jgi:hypothetical protein